MTLPSGPIDAWVGGAVVSYIILLIVVWALLYAYGRRDCWP